ncbi:unnamed protein product [Rotaria magnacalcarata]|uniref:Uncharacterized protein n=1 Tax=Rotaria magnacalcarata TaxID=392030 RepID=A0A816N6K1_9BILA|nr:unnamed protein product [Rotaria magnacalcarata]CAF1226212.1 unnamed protein product [Rotaria magnacalcarata]CAF1922746.1 unnamed protein product [Rotaria magnacalcarata]CAF2025558.1 unnamed protein product [Rotaria magnacalcarata]CAF2146880.1 unnamed protein product [Rotaria magnacalcarata]
MKLSTRISQKLSSNFVTLNWILVLATIFFVCCSCIHSKPTDFEQLTEQQVIDNIYPAILVTDDIVERAAPRLGRASPRLGRASPRLGRHAAISRLNHAGRYYIGDDDAVYDSPLEFDSSIDGKRAAPRLGRSV